MLSIIVFGASGDLATKMTFPALFALYVRKIIPEDFQIIGYARSKLSQEAANKIVTAHIPIDDTVGASQKALNTFVEHYKYVPGTYDKPESFEMLNSIIAEKETAPASECTRIFYLVLPPHLFAPVSELIKSKAHPNGMVTRLIVEKPIGFDYKSADAILSDLSKHWSAKDTFKVDHFLGEDMIDGFTAIRFANSMFEPIWNREHIESVRVDFREDFGCEGRGGYFEGAGILRDVVQNHLLQLLTLLCIEEPKSQDAEDIIKCKVDFLKSLHPVSKEDIVYGQYTKSANGKVPGYRELDGVADDSEVSTFCALQLRSEAPRWKGIPIIISAGKGLDRDYFEARITFKRREGGMFPTVDSSNVLVLRVYPKEFIALKGHIKQPGFSRQIVPVTLDVKYPEAFPDTWIHKAYEVVIADAINGKHTHFISDDEVRTSWKIFDDVLDTTGDLSPLPYAFGSHLGPDATLEFFKKRNLEWD
ncbi:Glucose-6-phosphate 1-dehydrogenase [Schizosaccharomyces pombe]